MITSEGETRRVRDERRKANSKRARVKYGLIAFVMILLIGACILVGIICVKHFKPKSQTPSTTPAIAIPITAAPSTTTRSPINPPPVITTTSPPTNRSPPLTPPPQATTPLLPAAPSSIAIDAPDYDPKKIKHITGTQKIDQSDDMTAGLKEGVEYDNVKRKFKYDGKFVAPNMEEGYYKEKKVVFGEQFYYVPCPYCPMVHQVKHDELNCCIFRCGRLQTEMGQSPWHMKRIPPHEKEGKINESLKGPDKFPWVRAGCGGAFKVVGEDKANKVAVTVTYKS